MVIRRIGEQPIRARVPGLAVARYPVTVAELEDMARQPVVW